MLSSEPTAIIQAVVAILNAVQLSAIAMPVWLHTTIAVATIALGAVANRALVRPAARSIPAPPVVPPPPTVVP